MTATRAPSGRPAWAVYSWIDNNYIYVELPGKGEGPSYITKYPLHDVSKALALMRSAHYKAMPSGGSYRLPEQPIIRQVSAKAPGTADQRARATALLKKLGITK